MKSLEDLTFSEKEELLGEKITPPLYYNFSDFKYKTEPKERVLSGISELDYMLKGFEMAAITIWTGYTNSGKTTVMTTLTKMALEQKQKIFFFNGEQTKDDFKNNLYKQLASKDKIIAKPYGNSGLIDYFVTDDEATRLAYKYNKDIFLYNNEAPKDIDSILYAMNEAYMIYKVKIFIIDNFMQIDLQSSDVFQEQSRIMEKLREFAVNNEVHIHLVAHPRKTEKGQTRIGIEDISGTMNMVNKAYNVISIMRVDTMEQDSKDYKYIEKQMIKERYDINKTSTILEVIKQKGNRNGMVGLIFDPITRSFRPQPKMTELEYERAKREYMCGAEPYFSK